MEYLVSHFWFNPRRNQVLRFNNLKDANEEFHRYQGEGCSYLEIVGDADSWKKREWGFVRATYTAGKFKQVRRKKGGD